MTSHHCGDLRGRNIYQVNSELRDWNKHLARHYTCPLVQTTGDLCLFVERCCRRLSVRRRCSHPSVRRLSSRLLVGRSCRCLSVWLCCRRSPTLRSGSWSFCLGARGAVGGDGAIGARGTIGTIGASRATPGEEAVDACTYKRTGYSCHIGTVLQSDIASFDTFTMLYRTC